MVSINYWAVIAAAAANFIIGFLLHGPVLGKTWMKLAKIHPTGKEKLSEMVPQMVKNFLVNALFAYVLAAMYVFAASSPLMGMTGVFGGMLVALWVWLGFIFTTTSIEVIWMGRSYQLWWFELFASLLSCLAMGAIIGAW